jgi:hypothetical protein
VRGSVRERGIRNKHPVAIREFRPLPARARGEVKKPQRDHLGAEVRKDRPIDGVDELDFFLGKQENSNREGFPAYVADRLSAVKWRNWKMHLIWQEKMYDAPQVLPLPRMFNLLSDRKEEREVATYNTWVADPMFKILSNFKASLETSPPIKVGTPDPYIPPITPTAK